MKIGIIGTQNSHTDHFCKVLNEEKACAGACAAYVYGGDDPEQAKKLAEQYGVEICASEEELIEKSDVVAITYRKGSMHFEPAMKVLKAGKPLFNDKPFTVNMAQCLELTNYARENNLLLTGGSNLKGMGSLQALKAQVKPGSLVTISFAADCNSEYDGYWFYGMHSAEMCIALCGEEYTSVNSFKNGDAVVTIVTYADKQCVICNATTSHDIKIAITNGDETTYNFVALEYQSVGPQELVEMVNSGKLPRPLSHYEKSVELVSRMVEAQKANA